MSKDMVVQCLLTSDDRRDIGFIDARHAVKGRRMQLEGFQGWWTVQEVYKDSAMTAAQASERSMDHGRQREFSDA